MTRRAKLEAILKLADSIEQVRSLMESFRNGGGSGIEDFLNYAWTELTA